MAGMTLVTGGARSGKSAFAESLLDTKADIQYIATNGAAQDEEMRTRVGLHQKRRPKNWTTTETYLKVPEAIEAAQVSGHLLDCATMLTTNYFFEGMKRQFGEDFERIDKEIVTLSEKKKLTIQEDILYEWSRILTAAKNAQSELVIVTNEVGLGIVPENAFSRWFRDVLGTVNQTLGKEADAVFLVIAGIPMKIK